MYFRGTVKRNVPSTQSEVSHLAEPSPALGTLPAGTSTTLSISLPFLRHYCHNSIQALRQYLWWIKVFRLSFHTAAHGSWQTAAFVTFPRNDTERIPPALMASGRTMFFLQSNSSIIKLAILINIKVFQFAPMLEKTFYFSPIELSKIKASFVGFLFSCFKISIYPMTKEWCEKSEEAEIKLR